MSNFKRPAIVSLAAITGAQLSAIVLSPQPSQSSNCPPWSPEGISQAIQRQAYRKPADPLDGRPYWENNVWADSQPQASATPSAVAAKPLARTPVVSVSPRVVSPQPVESEPPAEVYIPTYSGSLLQPKPGDANYSPTDAAAGLYKQERL